MSNKQAYQLSDDSLLKCMRDYLDNPTRYHPEYLKILLDDYERRVKERIEYDGESPKNNLPDFKHTPPCPPRRVFPDADTSTNATIKYD